MGKFEELKERFERIYSVKVEKSKCREDGIHIFAEILTGHVIDHAREYGYRLRNVQVVAPQGEAEGVKGFFEEIRE